MFSKFTDHQLRLMLFALLSYKTTNVKDKEEINLLYEDVTAELLRRSLLKQSAIRG